MKLPITTLIFLIFSQSSFGNIIDPKICDISIPEVDLSVPVQEKVIVQIHTAYTFKHDNMFDSDDVRVRGPVQFWYDRQCFMGECYNYGIRKRAISETCQTLINNKLAETGNLCGCKISRFSFKGKNREYHDAEFTLTCQQDEALASEHFNQIMCKKLDRCQAKLPLTSTKENFHERNNIIHETKDFLSCN